MQKESLIDTFRLYDFGRRPSPTPHPVKRAPLARGRPARRPRHCPGAQKFRTDTKTAVARMFRNLPSSVVPEFGRVPSCFYANRSNFARAPTFIKETQCFTLPPDIYIRI